MERYIDIEPAIDFNSEFSRKIYNGNFGSLLDENVTRTNSVNMNDDAETTGISEYSFKDNILRISQKYAPFKPEKLQWNIEHDRSFITISFNQEDVDGDNLEHTISRKLCRKYLLPQNVIKEQCMYRDEKCIHLEVYFENSNTKELAERKFPEEKNSKISDSTKDNEIKPDLKTCNYKQIPGCSTRCLNEAFEDPLESHLKRFKTDESKSISKDVVFTEDSYEKFEGFHDILQGRQSVELQESPVIIPASSKPLQSQTEDIVVEEDFVLIDDDNCHKKLCSLDKKFILPSEVKSSNDCVKTSPKTEMGADASSNAGKSSSKPSEVKLETSSEIEAVTKSKCEKYICVAS